MRLEEFRDLLRGPPDGYIEGGSIDFRELIRIKPYPEASPWARCEHCGDRPASRGPLMTSYEWRGEGQDPNEPPILCAECGAEWVDSWQAQWDEYYAGLL